MSYGITVAHEIILFIWIVMQKALNFLSGIYLMGIRAFHFGVIRRICNSLIFFNKNN